jgi:hypothetical protein
VVVVIVVVVVVVIVAEGGNNFALFLSPCAAQPDETVNQHCEGCGEAALSVTNCDFHAVVYSCWVVHWSAMEFPFLVIFFSSEKYLGIIFPHLHPSLSSILFVIIFVPLFPSVVCLSLSLTFKTVHCITLSHLCPSDCKVLKITLHLCEHIKT